MQVVQRLGEPSRQPSGLLEGEEGGRAEADLGDAVLRDHGGAEEALEVGRDEPGLALRAVEVDALDPGARGALEDVERVAPRAADRDAPRAVAVLREGLDPILAAAGPPTRIELSVFEIPAAGRTDGFLLS